MKSKFVVVLSLFFCLLSAAGVSGVGMETPDYDLMIVGLQRELQMQSLLNKRLILALCVTIVLFLLALTALYIRYSGKQNSEHTGSGISGRRDRSPENFCEEEYRDNALSEEDAGIVEEVYHYIMENGSYRNVFLSLDSLCEETGINRNRLSRAINRATGNNFKQYVNEIRIREAVRLMKDRENDTMSLNELMEQAGYNCTSTFYEAFKKITGLTPAQYRKNIPVKGAARADRTDIKFI